MKNFNFEVVGTNTVTKKFDGRVFESPDFAFAAKNRCFVDMHEGGFVYVFELKIVRFVNEHVILEGFISDKENNVGRISLKYLP